MPQVKTGWLPESKVRVGNKKLWVRARNFAREKLGQGAPTDKVRQFARKVYLMWGGTFFPRKKVRVMKHKKDLAHFGVFD